MSLATRCPACGTAFRVVQDQLRVSGGWVRCGQCHQVFNGLESLQELPAAVPAVASPAAAAPPPPPASAPAEFAPPGIEPSSDVEGALVVDDGAEAFELSFGPDPASSPPAPSPVAPEPEPAEAPIPTGTATEAETGWSVFERLERAGAGSTGFDPVLRGVSLPAGPGLISTFGEVATAASQPAISQPADEPAPAPDAPEPRKRRRKPAFMKQAERAAQWQRPAVRALLGSASLLLLLMLVLQWAHQQRDELAARLPALRPALQAWCELARCQLEPPRAIARLAIESSSLLRTETPQVLRFEAELRNSADHPVRAPALELSFNDNQGHLLVRKVLLPEDLAAPAEGISAEGSWHVAARLQVGALPVSGFSAEVFYP